MPKGLVIGICGGTGSGKTTTTERIISALPAGTAVVLPQENYYKDFPNYSPEKGPQKNFDHPDAFDMALLTEHVRQLRAGMAIECPVYDFAHHVRQPHAARIEPHPAIIVDGILIFEPQALRDLMDIKIFVDTDADLRFIRRLLRDIRERGRTLESVVQQYLTTIRPMHLEFIEPSRRFADVIIPGGGFNAVEVDLLIQKIESLLAAAESPSQHFPS